MATDAELLAQAEVIENETTPGANSASRVGEMFKAIINNKPNTSAVDVVEWDLSTDTLPTGYTNGQRFHGTGATTLITDSGNPIPTEVLFTQIVDTPTDSSGFVFQYVI